jgi:hypothetical protein
MEPRNLGLLVIAIGAAAILVGALIATGALSWFGRLPGDIRIKSDSARIYIPITSMIVTSIALTVVINIVRRFF